MRTPPYLIPNGGGIRDETSYELKIRPTLDNLCLVKSNPLYQIRSEFHYFHKLQFLEGFRSRSNFQKKKKIRKLVETVLAISPFYVFGECWTNRQLMLKSLRLSQVFNEETDNNFNANLTTQHYVKPLYIMIYFFILIILSWIFSNLFFTKLFQK